MKNLYLGTAISMALALAGHSAQAGCTDPRLSAAPSAFQSAPLGLSQGPESEYADPNWSNQAVGERIVGTWHVTYSAGGTAYAQALIQWHSDRTEWENITMPVLAGNICMGSWKVVDRSHVFRNHAGWLFADGVISGYFFETETVDVARDGKTYTGQNATKLYQMDGTLITEIDGTSAAKRINP